jgi:hypothetical protein
MISVDLTMLGAQPALPVEADSNVPTIAISNGVVTRPVEGTYGGRA